MESDSIKRLSRPVTFILNEKLYLSEKEKNTILHPPLPFENRLGYFQGSQYI
jgi:hypothetical protein